MSNHLPFERKTRIVSSMNILNNFRRVVRDNDVKLINDKEKTLLKEAINIYQGKTKLGIKDFIPFCISGSGSFYDVIPVEIYFLFKNIEKNKSKIEEICNLACATLEGKEVSNDKKLELRYFLERGMDLAERIYSQREIKNPFYSN